MTTIRHARLAAVATLAVALVACGTTEPEVGTEIDTEAALADYDALEAALSSPEFRAFQALGGRTPFGGGLAGVEVVGALAAAPDADRGRGYALELLERVGEVRVADGPPAAPIISEAHRGATFVFRPELDDYGVDPERTGAPENGVRFVLYEVDETGRPIVDREIGHADLLDEGEGSASDIALRLLVVEDGVTVLDYRTALDDDGSRGLLTVRGFLRGEGVRLDFGIEAVGTRTQERATLDVAFDLGIDSRGFSIVGSVRGVEEGAEGEGDIDVTVRHRAHSLRMAVRGEAGTLEGTIFVNGDVFATVSGPAADPVFVNRNGEPLALGERILLHRIADTIEDVFDLLEDLVDPVDDLVILGVIL